jgi:hypothetical protein
VSWMSRTGASWLSLPARTSHLAAEHHVAAIAASHPPDLDVLTVPPMPLKRCSSEVTASSPVPADRDPGGQCERAVRDHASAGSTCGQRAGRGRRGRQRQRFRGLSAQAPGGVWLTIAQGFGP